MKNKLIFILYDSRSGSTLLASLLNRYRGIDVTLESAFVSRIFELENTSVFKDTNKLLDYLYEEVQFGELNINREELGKELSLSTVELNKKNVIETIIQLYFKDKSTDSKYWVIKHPPYNYIKELSLMFDDVKFLQIVRDGRAVFNSKKRSKSIGGSRMESNPIMAAIDWKLKIQKCSSFENITTIKYEDLIRNTEPYLSDYLDSLGLDTFDQEQTKDHKDYFVSIGSNQKGLHQNVGKLPKVSNIDKWQKELTQREIMVYNLVNKTVLTDYGYEIKSTSNYLLKIIYFIGYFIKLMFVKFVNVIKLTVTPKKLVIKFKRRFYLLR